MQTISDANAVSYMNRNDVCLYDLMVNGKMNRCDTVTSMNE